MKKKLISICLAAVLVFGASMTASAAPKLPSPNPVASSAPEAAGLVKIRQLTATILSDRQTLLTVESNNIQLTLKLRGLIAGLKSKAHPNVTPDTLNKLKSLQDSMKSIHKDLAGTNGQLSKLTAGYKKQLRSKNYENAAAELEQIIAAQQARIATKTEMNDILKQMIALLSAA